MDARPRSLGSHTHPLLHTAQRAVYTCIKTVNGGTSKLDDMMRVFVLEVRHQMRYPLSPSQTVCVKIERQILKMILFPSLQKNYYVNTRHCHKDPAREDGPGFSKNSLSACVRLCEGA